MGQSFIPCVFVCVSTGQAYMYVPCISLLSFVNYVLQKASQVMSRAARLNEAFSVVKRVPMIRPSLPAVGSTNNWPVMSLR